MMITVKTLDDVEENIRRACRTMQALPPVKARGYFTLWDSIIADDVAAQDGREHIVILPQDITHMDEVVFNWLPLLDVTTRRLVWMRCSGMGWKRMAYQRHRSKSTLQRLFKKGLEAILYTLK